MPFKDYTFEELSCGDVTLELEYSYSFTPGRYSGPPEDCYDSDEECEVCPTNSSWETEIINRHILLAREDIKKIRTELSDMADKVRQWANDDAEAAAEAKGEADFEERGLRGI